MEVVQEGFGCRSFLFLGLVVRKALLSPFMTNFINNRQSGMSSLTLTNLMICTSIVKNLINFLPLEKKKDKSSLFHFEFRNGLAQVFYLD